MEQEHLDSGRRGASLCLEGCNFKGESELDWVKDEVSGEEFSMTVHGNC